MNCKHWLKIFTLILSVSFNLFSETPQTPEPTMTLGIPMRDGTMLATDLYYPNGKISDLPCVLVRNPAGRKHYAMAYIPLAQAGYLVAIQDTRSAGDPDGKTFPLISDGWGKQQDGYDTIEWLAKSPLTNGKIGTMGFSAMGITQLMLAPSNPPNLVCQYIGVAASNIYEHAMFKGNAVYKNQVEGWLGAYARDPAVLQQACGQLEYNEFWAQLDSVAVADKVNVPAIHYGGWYDTFSQGTIDGFVARQEHGAPGARGAQKLIIGPWTHCWPQVMTLGDFDVPDQAKTPPVDISPVHWFNHFLKEQPNEIANLPAVTYYVMGPFDGSESSGNVWKTAEKWPVPAVDTPFYLSNDNKLVEHNTPEEPLSITYAYDPDHPVPTIGGNNLFLESGPKDQAPIEKLDDVIVFTTEPLKEDIEVTGRILATIFFSTNQAESDVVVRLTDVYPDGRSILIADGICNSAFSCNLPTSSGITQDEPIELDLDLWSTSIVFAKGHKIRVSVSSSNYPRYERNSNRGKGEDSVGPPLIANNSIHFGKNHPSRIVLPIVRRGN